MRLNKKTFMKKHMIKNVYNNISGMSNALPEYEYIEDILDDLEFAYSNNNENYLMNLLHEEAIKELINISEKYNIMSNDYPLGHYKKIGDNNE